jgi:hypothetical protein
VADNSTQQGADTIATDDVTSLNGNASSGVKIQRVKVMYGDDNTARDVSTLFPLPTTTTDLVGSGSISAADAASTSSATTPIPSRADYTQTAYAGTPTASSFVRLDVTGESAFSAVVTGTFVGTIQIERTINGTDWTPVGVFIAGSSYTTQQINAPAQMHGNTSAATAVRLRATAWTSGTASVTIRAGEGTGTITVGSPMRLLEPLTPAGNNGTGIAQIFTARAAITTAATSVLQAAPAAGLCLYITDVSVSNSGATLSTVSLLPTAGTAVLDIVAAASGGGGSMNFGTPIKLAAATGLSVTTSAASTTVYVTVTGYTSA